MAFNGIYIKKKHLINRIKSFEFVIKYFQNFCQYVYTNFMIHSGEMKFFYLYYAMLIRFFQNIIFYEIYLNSIFFYTKISIITINHFLNILVLLSNYIRK